jgi:hypothetical protein
MALIITLSASSSSSTSVSYYFLPSGFTPRREKIACPMPMNGLHPILSNTMTCSVCTKLEADPIGFLCVLINPPVAGIQTLIQPTE